MEKSTRSLPVGAELCVEGVHFRVWAPERERVEVVTENATVLLHPEGNGYYSGTAPGLQAGAPYRYRLDGKLAFPDPASRYQPEGPHGPSEVVDPRSYAWRDAGWQGLSLEGQVLYEMHVGTFTREGTWIAAACHLPELAQLGVTVIEMMPIADFSGSFGWGYDGVNLYAPTRLYGTPDDLRAFVDTAHAQGVAVILDVVYNHVGADGNYLGQFSRWYFSRKHTTDWGDAMNFDGERSAPVREFYRANAAYWVREFHFDGLRLDATQNIYDQSSPHILAEITAAVRGAAGRRRTIVVAENEPQETRLVRPAERGGYGMDGLWNDDLHHAAMVALTGRNEAYYTDYLGTAQEFVSAMKHGFLYQGQRYRWQKKRRGTPALDLPPHSFVTFLQNHDQIANSAHGRRIGEETAPAMLRAMTALLLLGPGTPMLFQGQEFASSVPFNYFADVPPDLRELVRKGRREFLSQWRSIRMPEMLASLIDPCSPETFDRSKLDHSERDRHAAMYSLHRDLIALRRCDPALRSWRRGHYDGAVLSEQAFLLRAFHPEGDRLLVVNLGCDLHLDPAPEPLLAPPEGRLWRCLLSTEHPSYGGSGAAPLDSEENWLIPGRSAALLAALEAQ